MVGVVGAGAYVTRDLWWHRVRDRVMPHAERHERVASVPADTGRWEPLTAAGAERAKQRVAALGARGGPGYITLSGGDFASYVVRVGGSKLPMGLDSASAAVIGRELRVRTQVDLRAITDKKSLGPVGAFLGERAPIELAGIVDTPPMGAAEFQITGLSVNGVPVPSALIPKLLGAIQRDHRQAGAAADGVIVPLPAAVGGVNIGGGRVTLYKREP